MSPIETSNLIERQTFELLTSAVPDCPYTAEQEECLCRRMKAGDVDARNAMVEACIPWAIKIAQGFPTIDGVDGDDRVQEAMVGLLESARRLVPKRGRLTTAAWWGVRRCLYDLKRKSDRYGTTRVIGNLVCDPATEREDSDIACQMKASHDHLILALMRLSSPRDTWVIWLTYFHGRTLKELSEAWGVSRWRISVIRGRAIDRLEVILDEMEKEDQ